MGSFTGGATENKSASNFVTGKVGMFTEIHKLLKQAAEAEGEAYRLIEAMFPTGAVVTHPHYGEGTVEGPVESYQERGPYLWVYFGEEIDTIQFPIYVGGGWEKLTPRKGDQ